MHVNFSESESRRFSLRMFRGGAVGRDKADELLEECIDHGADTIILRMEQETAAELLDALSEKCHAIGADALIEFRKPLNQKTIADRLGSGAEIVEINQANVQLLDGLVERCYSEYRNHYHANPCLDRQAVLSGLVEFSRSFAMVKDRTVLVAVHRGIPCGYLCMEIRDDHGSNGLPTGSRRLPIGSSVIGGSALDIPPGLRHKVLCDLTHAGDLWLLERNVTQFKALTRTEKSYIQKLLIRNMHCLPSRSLATIHINLFIDQLLKTAPQGEFPRCAAARPHRLTTFFRRVAKGAEERRVFQRLTPVGSFSYAADSDYQGIFSVAFSATPA